MSDSSRRTLTLDPGAYKDSYHMAHEHNFTPPTFLSQVAKVGAGRRGGEGQGVGHSSHLRML